MYLAPCPVPPLKGPKGTRSGIVSYRALAPGVAGTGQRVCVGASGSRPTAHYLLLTANWTFISGWQTFKYGKLGEVTENIRTFALPFESQTYTFKMQYEYDSWNRIQTMTYPDGEVVSYEYNRGGMLNKVFGSVTRNLWEMIEPVQIQGGLTEPDGVMGGGIAVPIDPPVGPIEPQTITYRYPYIDSIIYNVFELKDSVIYGNGTRVRYEYDSLQRLSHLRSYTDSGSKMQNITYIYDSASNITHVSNSAGSVSGLGGRYEGHYTYDKLYRLVAANGYWKNSRDSLPFSESMNYTANGRILKKTVNAGILNGNHSTTKSSDFRYSYASHSNQVSTITDGALPIVTQSFLWDDCGNVDRWAMLSKTGTQWLRTHTWTEDNRLQTVADNNWFSYYQYDAGGERTYKLTWAGSTSNRSGDRSIYYTPDEATLYTSPYLVITPQGYTKHYYAESERITSQLGKGQFADVGTPVVSDSLVQVKLQAVTGNVEYPATLTVPSSGTFAYLDTLTNQQNATSTLYFYHPDHLGSSSWITTTNGTVKQHLHYLPWGEDFVNQRSSHFDGVRYTFSAKEKDTETGYSYFGARYYSSDLSIWLSVDPMSDKYPSTSPYAYCRNNPIILVDPNGSKDRPFNRHTDSPTTKIKGTSTPIKKISCGKINIKFDIISTLTSYNCHSYAWHDSKGDNNPQKGDIPHALDGSELPLWDNNPADDIKEQNVRQLDPSEDNIPGDIVIYYTDNNSNNQYDDGEFITHSAVVKTVDEEGYTTEVIAKNGDKCLVVGHPDAPGYYKKDKDNNPTKRAYFRRPKNEERRTTNEN